MSNSKYVNVRNTLYVTCTVGGEKIVLNEKLIENSIRNIIRDYNENLKFDLVTRLVKNGSTAYIFVKNTEVYNLLLKLKSTGRARVEEIDDPRPIIYEFKEGEEPKYSVPIYPNNNTGYLDFLEDWYDWEE